MREVVKIWLTELFQREIQNAEDTIKNEHLWELGYDGGEPVNPHTENIEAQKEYIEYLKEKMEELK